MRAGLHEAQQGVLVRNILEAESDLKKAGERATAATAEEGAGADGGGTGIILQRRTRSAQNQKASDLTQVRRGRAQLYSLPIKLSTLAHSNCLFINLVKECGV